MLKTSAEMRCILPVLELQTLLQTILTGGRAGVLFNLTKKNEAEE